MSEMLTLEAFEEASIKVKEVTQETKLVESPYLTAATGNRVWLKPENMQRTGAYKVRGAYYKISTLTPEELSRGIITASAGNHAQGVAFAATRAGAKSIVVMPTTTPLIKVERTKDYGAEVVLHGDVYDEACEYAMHLAETEGYTFIHPFNDPVVATGQGTIAMEIVQELPLVDTILVPIGGGGLSCGVSTFAKLYNPKIRVIGVEPAGAPWKRAMWSSSPQRAPSRTEPRYLNPATWSIRMSATTWTRSSRSRTRNSSYRSWTWSRTTRWWWRTPACSPWRR